MLTRIILHNFAVFVAKKIWVFISCTVHRNKLIHMFINNINGVINKNLSLFFYPSDFKLAWKAKQKQRELTKNQLFFLFLCFFSWKFRIYGNQKHQFLKGDSIKNFWVKCWPFFKQALLKLKSKMKQINSKKLLPCSFLIFFFTSFLLCNQRTPALLRFWFTFLLFFLNRATSGFIF